MLEIFDKHKCILHQLDEIKADFDIEFHIQCEDLLDVFEDKDGFCVFYGFLDQEIKPEISTSNHLCKFLNQDTVNKLLQLYGSFNLIYFNKATQQLIFANDGMGDFLFNYIFEDNKYKFADFTEALLNKNNKQVNLDRVQHFFALTQAENNISFFKNINQQKPGHIIEINNKKFSSRQYYFPPKKINYKNQDVDSLCSQYNQLLKQAISLQSQGQKRIAVLMSGGLDSTLIAANSVEAGLDVNTYSYVFPQTTESNEAMWIDSMRKLKLNMNTFAAEKYWALKSPWYISVNSPYSNPYRLLKDSVSSLMQQHRIKYLLTGVYADHAYAGSLYWMIDLLKHKPITAISKLFSVVKNKGIFTALRQVSPKKWSSKDRLNASWLTKEVHNNLKNKLAQKPKNKIPHKQKHNLVFGSNTVHCAYFENEYSFKKNIYLRNPFRDRRVVEFASTLPAYILGDIYNQKAFARQAGKDLLPEMILRRAKTTTMEPLLLRGVLDEELEKVKVLLTSEECQWSNYVKKNIVLNVLDNPKKQHSETEYVLLWLCISFELWLKRLKTI